MKRLLLSLVLVGMFSLWVWESAPADSATQLALVVGLATAVGLAVGHAMGVSAVQHAKSSHDWPDHYY